MFTVMFVVFFALPAVLVFIGAIALQSSHLFFCGLIMTLASAIFFVVMRGVQKKKSAAAATALSGPPNP